MANLVGQNLEELGVKMIKGAIPSEITVLENN